MTTQYGAYALQAVQARLHPFTRIFTPMRSHAHTHTHTQKQICKTYHFSTATVIRKFALMLRYTLSVLFFLPRRCGSPAGWGHCNNSY